MRRRAAFSLVELLVVIGVVAVLFALLLPVIARVRRHAQATTCVTNLRQLGHAMVLYAQQNHGHLPAGHRFVENKAHSGDSRWWSWDDALAPLLGEPPPQAELEGSYTVNPSPLLQCPSDDRVPPAYLGGRPLGGLRSYSMTHAWGDSAGGMGVIGVAGVTEWRYVRLADARDASGTLLLVENHCDDIHGGNLAGSQSFATTPTPAYQRGVPRPGPPGMWDRLPPTHDGAWNYLFCDGHVDRLRPDETVTRKPGMTADERLNSSSGMWTRDTTD